METESSDEQPQGGLAPYKSGVTAGPETAAHDPHSFPPVGVAVDIVLMTISDGELRILLIRRGQPPFRDAWALPGGFVQPNETLDSAALRELAEETGITQPGHLAQLATYGHPERDPRQRVVTVGYWAITPDLPTPKGGTDDAYAEFVPVAELETGRLKLAFDHDKIAADAIGAAREELERTTIATRFCSSEFTISDLREVYDAVWDTELEPANFQRKVKQSKGFITPLGRKLSSEGKAGRPAELWTAGPADKLIPALNNPTQREEL